MAVTYGYFNSIDGDRTYNADQMSEYFDGLVSNGVYESVGGALQVMAGSGMTVNVQTGRGIINCKWLSNDSVLTLDITQAHAVLNRYTAVVLRLDIVNRLMTITTKDGANASNPVKPTMQNDSTMVELCLAYIYVGAGVTTISQANIEDMRASSSCGWVTGLIKQVNTSQLFLQWQTAYQNYYNEMTTQFENWLNSLTQELNVNTYIKQYRKRVVLSGGSSSNIIPMDMPGYTFANDDIISIYINGLYAAPEVDYIIDLRGSVPQLHPNASAAGTEIYIVVLKSKIGFSTVVGSDGSTLVGSDGSTIVGG
jgi:hypothetical protein